MLLIVDYRLFFIVDIHVFGGYAEINWLSQFVLQKPRSFSLILPWIQTIRLSFLLLKKKKKKKKNSLIYDISDFQIAKSKDQLLYLTIFGPFSSLESLFPSPFSGFFLPSWTWNTAVSIATHLSDHIPINLKTINVLTFKKFLFPA